MLQTKLMLHKLYPEDNRPSSLKVQEETQETLQKLNSTALGDLCANKKPKLGCKTSFPTTLANLHSLSNYSFFFFCINPKFPCSRESCDGWMFCAGCRRALYFRRISYSVVQVIFKAASHPLIPLSSPHLTIG